MKKTTVLLIALLAAFGVNAQTDTTFTPAVDTMAMYRAQVDTMRIAFNAPIGTEMYVAHYLEEPGISLQIAIATRGIELTDSILNDDNVKATVVVKGALIVRCFEVLRNVPEGYGADENKKLLTALMPTIISSPALAYVIGQLREQNEKTVLDIKRAGANKVKELQKIIE